MAISKLESQAHETTNRIMDAYIGEGEAGMTPYSRKILCPIDNITILLIGSCDIVNQSKL